MQFDQVNRGNFIQNLRRALPFSAHARPPLIAFLRARGVKGLDTPRLVILDNFDAGSAGGLMCRFAIAGEVERAGFVAPEARNRTRG